MLNSTAAIGTPGLDPPPNSTPSRQLTEEFARRFAERLAAEDPEPQYRRERAVSRREIVSQSYETIMRKRRAGYSFEGIASNSPHLVCPSALRPSRTTFNSTPPERRPERKPMRQATVQSKASLPRLHEPRLAQTGIARQLAANPELPVPRRMPRPTPPYGRRARARVARSTGTSTASTRPPTRSQTRRITRPRAHPTTSSTTSTGVTWRMRSLMRCPTKELSSRKRKPPLQI